MLAVLIHLDKWSSTVIIKHARYCTSTLYKRLGGSRTGVGGCGIDPRTVQPVAKRYTDCAILFHELA